MHKSGFINIIGQPNVGKSTLMNALVGERMSIITNKPQTTRHRILGLLSGDDFQMVFSDTPGLIRDPSYKMQKTMNTFVHSTFEDADIMLFVTDMLEEYDADDSFITKLKKVEAPLFLVINKVDLSSPEAVVEKIKWWKEQVNFKEIVTISALFKQNTDTLFRLLMKYLPEGPVYYPKDQLTDRPERFFVSEIIREKILLQYEQEIPYSCEVAVTSFKETQTNKGEDLVRIAAEIYVARKTQKAIIIGKGGAAIKKLGMAARKDLEIFLQQKVFLELFVKIKENWRDDDNALRRFGY